MTELVQQLRQKLKTLLSKHQPESLLVHTIINDMEQCGMDVTDVEASIIKLSEDLYLRIRHIEDLFTIICETQEHGILEIQQEIIRQQQSMIHFFYLDIHDIVRAFFKQAAAPKSVHTAKKLPKKFHSLMVRIQKNILTHQHRPPVAPNSNK